MWRILACSSADMAASSAVQEVDPTILQKAKQAAEHSKQEFQWLRKVFVFLVDLNIHQMKCIQERQKDNLLHLHSIDGSVPSKTTTENRNLENQLSLTSSHDDALTHMVQWNPQEPAVFLIQPVPEDLLIGCSLGQSYAITVWRWLQTLEWPPVDGNNPPNPLD